MKTIKAHLKAVACLLTLLILLQGCTVYKKSNITLEDAYKSEIQVKVKTNDNKTLKYKRIEFEDGKYYGVNEPYYRSNYPEHKKVESIKTHIKLENIEYIKIKDEKASRLATFAIPGVIVIAGIVALIIELDNMCILCAPEP